MKVSALYCANAALEDIVVGGAVAANHSMKASITAKPTTANALAPPIHKIVRLIKPPFHHTLHSGAFVHMVTIVGRRRIPQMSDFLLHATVTSRVLDAKEAYSPKCVEKEFCEVELRVDGVLRSSSRKV